MDKKKETKEKGRKWDGHSRPPTNLYKRNYDEIFKKEFVHKSKRNSLFTNQKETDRAIQAAVDQANKVERRGFNIECAVCGCMPKPDEWSSRVGNCCIDCG